MSVTYPARKVVVLLSGGLDSATVLAAAVRDHAEVIALSFDYGQRHVRELRCASRLCEIYGVQHIIIVSHVPLESALTTGGAIRTTGARADIPATYVPSRNLYFLSVAAGVAESVDASEIHIGVNAIDYSGYPDCRPEFIAAFNHALSVGTRAGLAGRLKVVAPLQSMSKADIIRMGRALHVPYDMTWSCYEGGARPCGRCDSCRLREEGFRIAEAKQ